MDLLGMGGWAQFRCDIFRGTRCRSFSLDTCVYVLLCVGCAGVVLCVCTCVRVSLSGWAGPVFIRRDSHQPGYRLYGNRNARARGGGANARARGAARARAPRWPRWPLRRCALVCGESECGLNVCGVWCRDGVRVRDHARGSVPLVRGAAVYFILYAIPYGRIGIRYTALLYYMSYCRPRVGRRALRTAQRTGGRGNTYLN